MSKIMFRDAVRTYRRLRLALTGPSGCGKTWTALTLATYLKKLLNLSGPICLIDSERGSSEIYQDLFAFKVADLENSHHPERYMEAIAEAEQMKCCLLIVDSLSHAWIGRKGELELVDIYTKRSQSGNSWAAWRDVTPMHNKLVDMLVGCSAHLIATLRAKTEWVTEKDEKGKMKPVKIGLAPMMRAGIEYEFDVAGDMDIENNFFVTKTRCSPLAGAFIEKPGEELASILAKWLTIGVKAVPALPKRPLPATAHTGPAEQEPSPADSPRTPAGEPWVAAVTHAEVGQCLIEWQSARGVQDIKVTKEKFITPLRALRLADVAPGDLVKILALLQRDYVEGGVEFPPVFRGIFERFKQAKQGVAQ